MIQIENKSKGVILSFPESYKEVNASILERLTNHIVPSMGKVLLALVKDCDLFQLATSIKGNKVPASGIIAIIAKADKEWLDKNHANIGDSVIITDSELERGVHVYINSGASFASLVNYLSSNDDARLAMVGRKFTDAKGNIINRICSLEFKMVNQYDIVGFIPIDSVIDDPFRELIKSE